MDYGNIPVSSIPIQPFIPPPPSTARLTPDQLSALGPIWDAGQYSQQFTPIDALQHGMMAASAIVGPAGFLDDYRNAGLLGNLIEPPPATYRDLGMFPASINIEDRRQEPMDLSRAISGLTVDQWKKMLQNPLMPYRQLFPEFFHQDLPPVPATPLGVAAGFNDIGRR